jgi:RNA polymerase sigma-70 factor (ECF subfamily)
MTVLNQVLARLEEEHRAAGKMQLFDRLQKSFTDEPDRSSQVKIAHDLGMTENAVYQAFHRFRQRYRELLREEVAHTVAVAVDIEDELRHLIAVLRA